MSIEMGNRSGEQALRVQGGQKGFVNDPLAHVNQIRDNLRDRYQNGFPVMKELLQNADDGGATRFWLVRSEGLPQAHHPLLASPALLVLNDGGFREADQKGIRQLGLSHRISESNTIGKFGLGLKSVFHLCEMFFFGASAVNTRAGLVTQQDFLEILNPWSGLDRRVGEFYSLWDQLSERDAKEMLARIRLVLDAERWFFLWLPLRQEHLCPVNDGQTLAISTSFPGDNLELEFKDWWPNLPEEFAGILPFLRHIQEVNLGTIGNSGFQVEAQLRLGSQSVRSAFPDLLEAAELHCLSGEVHCDRGNGGIKQLCYAGLEVLCSEPLFQELKTGPHWPRQNVLVVDDDDPMQCYDKNQPHAAVYLTHLTDSEDVSKDSESEMRILRSTFLPVGEPLDQRSIALSGKLDVYLHGFFFVDAGRSRVDTGDFEHPLFPEDVHDERSLHTFWNQELEGLGTLPLLPMALVETVHQAKLNFEQVCALTKALWENDYLKDRAEQVTLRHDWQCRLLGQDRSRSFDGLVQICGRIEGFQVGWVLIEKPSDTEAIRFPLVTSLKALQETFPNLEEFANQFPVLVPGMVDWSEEPPRTHLSDDELSILIPQSLDRYAAALLSGRSKGSEPSHRFEILLEVLRLSTPPFCFAFPSSQVARLYFGLAKALLKHLRGSRKDLVADVLRKILRNIPEGRLWTVDLENSDKNKAAELLVELNSLNLSCLIVPEHLAPEEASQQDLPAEDAIKILKSLHKREISRVIDSFLTEVLERAEEHSEDLLDLCPDLALFNAYLLNGLSSEGQNLRVSYKAIKKANNRGLLFLRSDIHHRLETATARALELRGAQVMILSQEAAKVLPYDLQPNPWTADRLLAALQSGPNLSTNPKDRLPLLQALVQEEFFEGPERRLMRVLAHGSLRHLNKMERLFFPESSQDETFTQICSKVLGFSGGEYRLVPAEISKEISPSVLHKLHIWQMGPQTLEGELERIVAQGNFDDLTFAPHECERLLEVLEEDHLVKKLSIHRTVDGSYVAHSDGTYLAPDPPFSRIGPEGVTFIAPSDNSKVLHRQRRLFNTFDRLAQLEVLLQAPLPQEQWSEIMELLDTIEEARKDPKRYRRLEVDLPQTDWIPTQFGAVTRPAKVWSLPPWDEEVGQLLRGSHFDGVMVTDLIPELLSHPNLGRLKTLFKSPDTVIKGITEVLHAEQAWSLGDCSALWKKSPTLKMKLLDMPETLCLPLGLTKSLHKYSEEVSTPGEAFSLDSLQAGCYSEKLLESLCNPTSEQRAWQLLNWTREEHRKSKGEPRRSLGQYFNGLLKEAIAYPRFSEYLKKAQFLNQEDEWRVASQLCFAQDNVDLKACLASSQAEILQRARNLTSSVARESQGSSSVLESSRLGLPAFFEAYFSGWPDRGVIPETIGGFLALFAVFDESLISLAKRYLDQRALNLVTEGLGLGLGQSWRVQFRPPGESEKYVPFSIQVRGMEPGRLSLPALTGELFSAPVRRDLQSLVLGKIPEPSIEPATHQLTWQLRLARLEPQDYAPEDLQKLLWQTAAAILKHCHMHGRANPETLVRQASDYWKSSLEQSKQLDIKTAQGRLRKDLPVLFQQLSPTADEKKSWTLSSEIKSMRDLDGELAELEASDRGSRPDFPTVRKKLLEAQASRQREIGRLLEHDAETHRRLLGMVRRKLSRHFQYHPGSVPFELFQNADDAVADFKVLPGDEERATHGEFSLQETEDHLIFRNNGRGVNQFQSCSGNEAADHTARFKNDLFNMLTLHASDKGSISGAGQVTQTGKFGLGFKSVFLVCDLVKVVSQRLAFEVVGGYFPRLPKDSSASWLPENQFSLETRDTALGLERPRGEQLLAGWRKVFPEFRAQADLQLVFSRHIKIVRLQAKGHSPETLRWTPWNLLDAVPEIQLGYRPSEPGGRQFLVVDIDEVGKVVLGLGAGRFEPLEPNLKRIWVTTPLTEHAELGFAVCADFDPDIGRGQLAIESKKNSDVGERLGKLAGQALARLVDLADSNWPEVSASLKLPEGTSKDNFKASLWQVVQSSTRSEELQLCDAVGRLRIELLRELERAAVIPTGLWGSYQGTLKREQIEAQVSGLLALKSIFEKCEPLLKACGFEEGLIHQSVAQPLSERSPEARKVSELKLDWLLEIFLEDQSLSPEQARLLAEVLPRSLFEPYQAQYNQEIPALESCLASVSVRSAAGTKETLELMLVARDDLSKQIAIFAPQDRLLAQAYSSQGESFMGSWLSKDPYPAAQTVVNWIFKVTPEDQTRQQGVLRFLLNQEHDLIDAVVQQVSKKLLEIDEHWLKTCDFGAFGFSEAECKQLELDLRLKQFVANDHWFHQIVAQHVQQRNRSANSIERLKALHDWWQRNGKSLLAEYEKSVYPRTVEIPWQDLISLEGPNAEKGWLTFFMLSTLQRLGRQTDSQNRDFVQLWHDRGWFDRLIQVDREKFEIVEILDEYFEEKPGLEYFHWLGCLPAFYQFSRWREDYIHRFISLQDPDCRVYDVLRARQSRYFQGGYDRAPDLERSLGIGACFALRELVRQETLDNPALYPYCYVPSERVRKNVSDLLDVNFEETENRFERSILIHKTVQRLGSEISEQFDFTFGKTFDLPFRLCPQDVLDSF